MDFKRPDREQQKFWEQASLLYQSQMTKECLTYLSGRGLSEETIQSFRLGFVETPLAGHETYSGRLCIPYIKKNATVALKFRCIESHDCGDISGHTKYLCEGSLWLYNTNDLDVSEDYVSLAEGEIDAMILHQAGIPAVGIPGVQSWKGNPHWSGLLKPYEQIYMFADNDKSKKENYGHQLAGRVKADLPRARIVTLPDDEDVNSTYTHYGARELFERAGLPWEESFETPSLYLVSA